MCWKVSNPFITLSFHINHFTNMKVLFTALLLVTGIAFGQHTDCLSKTITMNGEVKKEVQFHLTSLDTIPMKKLADFTITDHKGAFKSTLTNLEGVELQYILKQAVIKMEKPKLLSEFYFVFTACDGYKVVYSWNELFNSRTGDNIYLVKEKNGETLSSICTADAMTGRRYVQGLSSITIKRAE